MTLRDWIAAERRVHRRVDRRLIDPGTLEGVDPYYLPERGNTFELPCFEVPRSRVHVFGDAPDGPVRFFVHPLALPKYRAWLKGAKPGPRFFATPTSSTRTVFAWNEHEAFCVKVTLPGQLAGEPRIVTAGLARDAVEATRALRGLRGGLRILPEPLGVVPRDPRLGGWLLRELPRHDLTPWFALEHPERHIGPFLRAWMTSAIDHGWVADVHAQNVLAGGGGYWVRDLDSVWRDDPELEGVRTSLHTYFLGGPARRHRALFFRELAKHCGAAVARDADAFAQWLEDRRHERKRGQATFPSSSAHDRRTVPTGKVACPLFRRWLRLEQTVNPRRRDPKRFARVSLSQLPERFRPESQPVWRLPYFVAPLDRVRVHGEARPKALFVRRGGVRVFFHPMMASHYALDVLEYGAGTQTFWATPTASPRSVVVWNDRHAPFGLKLSLDVELLGINRLVEDSKLMRAVAVSSVLRGVRVLREPVSVATGEKDYGFIYRELLPDMNALTPGFSAEFDARRLPALVSAFAELAFGQGLIGDLHQQNVLFGPGGEVVLRDLDSFKCDADQRALKGLRTPAGMKVDARAYDRAWRDELRGEWLYLAPRSQRRRLAGRLDVLIMRAAQRHLGSRIVAAELAHLARRGWRTLSHGGEPLYSLDAMVRAFKLRSRRG